MNIKLYEIEPEKDNPFGNCKLEREKYADVLTSIIDSYPFGFVLGINNKWGTGKTTFVKMWEQKLKNNGHQTVYFNAWENDFEDNPLTALMGELKVLTKKSTEKEFKATLKKAATLSKHIAPVIAQAIADKYIDTKSVKEAIDGVSKGLLDVFENEVNEYAEKKKNITDFKVSLSEFIANNFNGKPLIFIIDELDRCRPNYAVSILEQIKHFFSVSNIVFVLSIDKTQLGNAVKGVYGSEHIDSDEYLRRFIDLEYSIPEPDEDVYYKYLYDYFEFDKFFDSSERKKSHEVLNDGENFIHISNLLFNNRNIPLRLQEKIFGLARVALRGFGSNSYVVPHVFLFLTFIKVTDFGFYQDLKNKKLSLKEVQEKFLKIVELNKTDKTEHELMWLEVYLVNFYNNYKETSNDRESLYVYDGTLNSNKLLIDSIINKNKNSDFLYILENINRGRREGNLDLGYFVKRIDLLENLKT
ncbi:MAG: P-loop NTPase fold protein [Gelidibacter sp.]